MATLMVVGTPHIIHRSMVAMLYLKSGSGILTWPSLETEAEAAAAAAASAIWYWASAAVTSSWPAKVVSSWKL